MKTRSKKQQDSQPLTVGLNSTNRIAVERSSYQGHDVVIIRKQYLPSGEESNWKYTKEGLTLREEVFLGLMDILRQVEEDVLNSNSGE